MLKIENVETYGWEAAIRGMRNPMNSWEKSDSAWHEHYGEGLAFDIGKNDLDLMRRLFKAGTEHRKYMRMLMVSMDVTAPLYWWKEFDTYKVGTVANSCSTMHKIAAKEFTLDDFSCEHLTGLYLRNLENTIGLLNDARAAYLESHSKDDWWQMIQLLPSSYNQRRTVMMNYDVAANILRQRRNHKLDEWHIMCDEIMRLPYFREITEG